MTAPLPDIQSLSDTRQIPIGQVGVRRVRHPVSLKARDGAQQAAGVFDMFVALPASEKGTHMSRFLEVLRDWREPLSVSAMRRLLQTLLSRLTASAATIEARSVFFIRKRAPVSGAESFMDYEVAWRAEQSETGAIRIAQIVTVPVKSLCPCSRDISDFGAHNQRSHCILELELQEDYAIEEQVRIAEDNASCEVWALLKRPDEKYVTERAFQHPKFVEDMVRDMAAQLRKDARVTAFAVSAENFESIHNHSAYARIEERR